MAHIENLIMFTNFLEKYGGFWSYLKIHFPYYKRNNGRIDEEENIYEQRNRSN